MLRKRTKTLSRKKLKQARLDELMDIQQGISAELSAAKIGKQMKIIIDRVGGGLLYRTNRIRLTGGGSGGSD